MSAFALVARPYIPFSQREGELSTHRRHFVLTGSPNHSALSSQSAPSIWTERPGRFTFDLAERRREDDLAQLATGPWLTPSAAASRSWVCQRSDACRSQRCRVVPRDQHGVIRPTAPSGASLRQRPTDRAHEIVTLKSTYLLDLLVGRPACRRGTSASTQGQWTPGVDS